MVPTHHHVVNGRPRSLKNQNTFDFQVPTLEILLKTRFYRCVVHKGGGYSSVFWHTNIGKKKKIIKKLIYTTNYVDIVFFFVFFTTETTNRQTFKESVIIQMYICTCTL